MEGIRTAFYFDVNARWLLDGEPLKVWAYEADDDGEDVMHQLLYDAAMASDTLLMDDDPSRGLRLRTIRHDRYGADWSSGWPRPDYSTRLPGPEDSSTYANESGVRRSRYTGEVIPTQRPYGYLSGRSRARSPYPRSTRPQCFDDTQRSLIGNLVHAAKSLCERATRPVRRVIESSGRCS